MRYGNEMNIESLPLYKRHHDKNNPGGVKGLHIQMRKGGLGTWMIYYRTRAGYRRQMKIGDYPTFSLEQAREIARQILVKVTLGEDPYITFSTLRDSPTIQEVWESLLPTYDRPRFKRSGHGEEMRRIYDRDIAPRFAHVRALDVDRISLKKWHQEYADKPSAGNHAMRAMAVILRHAIDIGAIPFSPAKGFKYFPAPKRKRYATAEEVKRLGEYLASRGKNWRRQVLFIYMLLFTGARPSTVSRTRWEELRKVGEGPDMYGVIERKGKTSEDTGENEKIIVPGWLVTELENLLPRYETILGIEMPRDFWASTCKACGIEGLWARDLRKTYATLALSGGESMDIVAELLNHKSTQTTKIYASLMDDAREKAAARVQSTIGDLVLPVGSKGLQEPN